MGRVICPCAFVESQTLIRPSIPNKISIVPLRHEMVGGPPWLWLSLLSSFKALFPLCALLWTSKTFIVRVLISRLLMFAFIQPHSRPAHTHLQGNRHPRHAVPTPTSLAGLTPLLSTNTTRLSRCINDNPNSSRDSDSDFESIYI